MLGNMAGTYWKAREDIFCTLTQVHVVLQKRTVYTVILIQNIPVYYARMEMVFKQSLSEIR